MFLWVLLNCGMEMEWNGNRKCDNIKIILRKDRNWFK